MEKFQMKKLAITIALGISAITGTNVMAQVSSFEEAKQQIAAGKSIVEIGFAKESSKPLKGFATGLPLVEVLKQITPNGWMVKKNDTAQNRIDINKLVSWTGGSAWNITLEGVVRQAGTNAIIDWDKKEVTLIAVPAVTTKTITVTEKETTKAPYKDGGVSVFELEGTKTETVVNGESNYKNMQSVDNKEKELVTQSWSLDSDKSLKQNVISWASQAGYKVEWIGEDYNVDRSMTIFGEFDGEDGPIRQLSVDYGPDSRLQKPLSFVFYQNKVLVVEDMKYEQQGFPQFSQ